MEFDSFNYTPKEVIKIIREWTGLTQEEFGKLVGKKGKSWTRHVEHGDTNFLYQDLYKICNLYGIQIIFKKVKVTEKDKITN